MEQDHTLEELLRMLKVAIPFSHICKDKMPEEWCRAYRRCEDCRNALVDAIERKAAEEYVKLPVDADGEVIHVGDVMENLRLEPPLHHMFTVYGIHYRAYGRECVLTQDGYPTILYRASEVRHHTPPTVEDVLREFALACEDAGNAGPEVERIAADFAKRLRLAEKED